jgi:regulator of replication initiation timing
MDARDKGRMQNLLDLVEYLREENTRLRAENEKFRERLIAFTGKDPR